MASTHEEESRRSTKSERFDARITREQKELFARAAALKGRSVTEFVIASAYEIAAETVRDHEVLTLSRRDTKSFVDALLHPKGPSRRLREAARRYQKRR
jgi:uncharacterized protein (DUF1778 family)